MEQCTRYQKLLKLENATFTLIEHEDAIVATVYKVILAEKKTLILKISDQPHHYFRELQFLKQLASTIPIPKVIQFIAPHKDLHGAILMECLPGNLLNPKEMTESLAYELGATFAKLHQHRLSDYGDPINNQLSSDPKAHFKFKFSEGLDECRNNISIDLVKRAQLFFETNLDLLQDLDGPCVIHRDFRPGNILVDQGKLQGIIDWAGARASFAEEDFCTLEHCNWLFYPMKNFFLEGYESVRPIPNYSHLIPLLRLHKAIATIGYTVKSGTWNKSCSRLYQYNLDFLKSLLGEKESHFEKLSIDIRVAKKLIATQFPQFKELPISPVKTSGWDNYTFHLGDALLIRMPSAKEYEAQVEKEHCFLPKLVPLPLEIPHPIGMGEPSKEYPFKWSIYQWIEGETLAASNISDFSEIAKDLANFLIAFHKIDAAFGPKAGAQNFYRGGSLKIYEVEVKRALKILNLDPIVEKIWDAAIQTSWEKKPVWVHGDISAGNLLLRKKKLSGVIDFGQLGIGDPACDLTLTWTLFSGKSREIFQKMLSFDEGTWIRSKAWALWKALVVAAGFTNPGNTESRQCWQIIETIIKY